MHPNQSRPRTEGPLHTQQLPATCEAWRAGRERQYQVSMAFPASLSGPHTSSIRGGRQHLCNLCHLLPFPEFGRQPVLVPLATVASYRGKFFVIGGRVWGHIMGKVLVHWSSGQDCVLAGVFKSQPRGSGCSRCPQPIFRHPCVRCPDPYLLHSDVYLCVTLDKGVC
ncbi:unnamed protein product [Merluccius merluccius]